MAEIVTCQNLITLLVLLSKENLRLQSVITDLQRRRKSHVAIQFDQELLQEVQSAIDDASIEQTSSSYSMKKKETRFWLSTKQLSLIFKLVILIFGVFAFISIVCFTGLKVLSLVNNSLYLKSVVKTDSYLDSIGNIEDLGGFKRFG